LPHAYTNQLRLTYNYINKDFNQLSEDYNRLPLVMCLSNVVPTYPTSGRLYVWGRDCWWQWCPRGAWWRGLFWFTLGANVTCYFCSWEYQRCSRTGGGYQAGLQRPFRVVIGTDGHAPGVGQSHLECANPHPCSGGSRGGVRGHYPRAVCSYFRPL